MIKVLQKFDAVLQAVADDKTTATLVELSRRLKIHKATLSHILQCMTALGYLERNDAKCYAIGPRIIGLGASGRRRAVLYEVAAEQVRSLSEELRELTSVSIIHDGIRYRIARASVNQSITVEDSVESRGAPYDTATGRMLMAHLDREDLCLVLKKNGFPGCRWNGIERGGALNKMLAEIYHRGVAFWRADDGQAEAVAVPVFGPDRKVWAAIGVSVPAFRFRGAKGAKIIRALKSAGEQMTFNLALRYGDVDTGEKTKG